ncbi:SIS domain-containing protein [Salibacterium aidingense]|uniref:SIS domain-containing protein n=1 Tax=Salibacterium aidingense TaxID=384933 RepID=UPI003BDF7680
MVFRYIDHIQELLKAVKINQADTITQAVEHLAHTISNNGIIHVFGAGHSHILSEEVFYRAGGLVPVNPLLEESLMLHQGARQSSLNERKENYIFEFLEQVSFQSEDSLIVISTSGRNPVPIDVARYGKAKEMFVMGITSIEYSKSQPSRHESGDRLFDSVDLVLDNLSKKGDALLTHPRVPEPYAASSTVIGAVLIQSLFAGIIEKLADKGETPPVFLSGNVDGADEHNRRLIEKYKQRISLLK